MEDKDDQQQQAPPMDITLSQEQFDALIAGAAARQSPQPPVAEPPKPDAPWVPPGFEDWDDDAKDGYRLIQEMAERQASARVDGLKAEMEAKLAGIASAVAPTVAASVAGQIASEHNVEQRYVEQVMGEYAQVLDRPYVPNSPKERALVAEQARRAKASAPPGADRGPGSPGHGQASAASAREMLSSLGVDTSGYTDEQIAAAAGAGVFDGDVNAFRAVQAS